MAEFDKLKHITLAHRMPQSDLADKCDPEWGASQLAMTTYWTHVHTTLAFCIITMYPYMHSK